MNKFVNKLVEHLITKKKSQKDLLSKLRMWTDEFDKEASYSNYVDCNKAKQKYILMRWNEEEKKIMTGDSVQGFLSCAKGYYYNSGDKEWY